MQATVALRVVLTPPKVIDCTSSAGSDESFHRAAGGLSPEPRRGSGGVFDGYGEKRSFVIASDSRGKNKSMGTASGFQPFIRT